MNRREPRATPSRILGIPLFALLTVAGCQSASKPEAPQAELVAEPDASAPAAVSEEPIMRTYEVPNGRAEELRSVLRTALSMGNDHPPRGRVSRLDDNRIVVVAPPSIQAGVAELCRDFEGQEARPAPITVGVDYWIVKATPAPEGSAEELPGPLESVATEILRDGPAHLSLLEHLELSSTPHEWSHVEGRAARLRQRFSRYEDRLIMNLQFEMSDSPSKVETSVAVEPEKFLVLGHAGHRTDGPESTLYYVMRVNQPTG